MIGKLTKHTFQVGKHSLALLTQDVGFDGCVHEEHDDEDTTGFALWPCSTLVAGLLLKYEDNALSATDVLDLGCGTGFCGLMAAQCQCRSVTLSDREPRLRALARRNSDLQPDMPGIARASVENYGWECGDAWPAVRGGFGLIVASDVLYTDHCSTRYDPSMLARFIGLIDWSLTAGGTVIIGHVERNCMGEADLHAALQDGGFLSEVLHVDDCVSDAILMQPGNIGVRCARVTRCTRKHQTHTQTPSPAETPSPAVGHKRPRGPAPLDGEREHLAESSSDHPVSSKEAAGEASSSSLSSSWDDI